MRLLTFTSTAAALLPFVGFGSASNADHLDKRASLQVDLGYSIYQGQYTAGLNLWQGIRYAAPPVGKLRFQKPQPPVQNRSAVMQANSLPHSCLQANNPFLPSVSEDCLFLNVYAPQNANNLPVVVYIHGEGYEAGSGIQNLTDLILANNASFVGVTIQYRLGATGFVSSNEVHSKGTVNAGLKDQTFSLQWVQQYISLFGGNPKAVTIFGESASAGSVMIQALIHNGTNGTSLFNNVIAASPYLPMQQNYNGTVPEHIYYVFANTAGCASGPEPAPGTPTNYFDCLVSKDFATIQNASLIAAAAGGLYSTSALLPVTDTDYLLQRPSQQTQSKQVNGLRILSGNNAEEGASFVYQNISTEQDLRTYISNTFPHFTSSDVSQLLSLYPGNTGSSSRYLFATLGNSGPTAVTQSACAIGNQQRANVGPPTIPVPLSHSNSFQLMYGETTFICPSHWLAEAFSGSGHAAYKYQYSVPAAIHAADLGAYFGAGNSNFGPDYIKAFETIFGNFITNSNPSIPNSLAYGSHNPSPPSTANPISSWPAFTLTKQNMINLNENSGTEYTKLEFQNVIAREHDDPGLVNNITLVDAASWEGGRAKRCEF